ncbi:hypothetical protein KAX21_00860 [candidate division WOR-3 bacterium]|nr:hypothetical protein [candidate division WOR-3 bacterium]
MVNLVLLVFLIAKSPLIEPAGVEIFSQDINKESKTRFIEPGSLTFEVIGVRRGIGFYADHVMLPSLGGSLGHIRSYWGGNPALLLTLECVNLEFLQSVWRYPDLTLLTSWTAKLGIAWLQPCKLLSRNEGFIPRVELSCGLSLLNLIPEGNLNLPSQSIFFSSVNTNLRWIFAKPLAVQLQHRWFPLLDTQEKYRHSLVISLSASLVLDSVEIYRRKGKRR